MDLCHTKQIGECRDLVSGSRQKLKVKLLLYLQGFNVGVFEEAKTRGSVPDIDLQETNLNISLIAHRLQDQGFCLQDVVKHDFQKSECLSQVSNDINSWNICGSGQLQNNVTFRPFGRGE
jgi:hypothetical protein